MESQTQPQRMSRRRWLGALMAALPLATVRAAVLPQATSLKLELDKALAKSKPLVVMVSLEGCPFCKVARDSYLAPLLKSGQPIVQVDMKSRKPLRDFDGSTLTQDEWIRLSDVRTAPTVLFFGAAGREVAPRLEGAGVQDYYGAYLEERIEQARKSLKAG